MNKHRIDELIEKSLKGNISLSEKEELNSWYRHQNEQDVQWLDSTPNEQAELEQRMLGRIRAHIIQQRSHTKHNSKYWIGLAASIAVLVLFTTIYMVQKRSVSSKHAIAASFAAPQKFAENRYVHLPDGSIAILRRGSNLSYKYNGGVRELYLSGEAYFDVKHQADHPFIVHTGNLLTTVLGTAFNIKAIPGQAVTVTVTRGKVSVADQVHKTLNILTPNQQVVSSKEEIKTTPEIVETSNLLSWAKVDMQFTDMPYEQLAERLSRRYGVEITFKNPAVKKCLITGRFSGTEPLEQVLQIISQTLSTTYTATGNSIAIDGTGCL
ncbi:FecR family protein [Mucilaginibacter sp. KACC 22063]|uniref:FecR family protein n=1 Tax=Mucilaginibacter sp. KACC 22063 TaxID=3025666 RepID=UPI002365EA78|nr:FecR domain-containing protein [Mucilaginibacter sp. KACC 22063]WDF57407.1 DUF4974 domain-containing protein [Mucilaginibacter sp. KACC 22063]